MEKKNKSLGKMLTEDLTNTSKGVGLKGIKDEVSLELQKNRKDPNPLSEYDINQLKLTLGNQYGKIIEVLKEYSDIKQEYYPIISLWVIGTYLHDNFNTFPYLYFNAMRGSGKTRLLKLISHLGHGGKGKVQTGLTEAALFRSERGNLLVLDEMESILEKNKGTMREYLNACYKKGVTVSRTKKVKKLGEETYEIEEFEPYRPIAMANIIGMEEVLGDRCITLILEKSNNPLFTKKVENFSESHEIMGIVTTLSKERCRLCRVVTPQNILTTWNIYINAKYGNNNTTTTTTTTTQTTQQHLILFNKIDEANIDGRNLELTLPLLLIADFLSSDLLDYIIEVMKNEVQIKKDDEFAESKDVSFIDFVSQHTNQYFISIKKLTQEFRDFLQDDDRDNEINTKWVGNALKRLKLAKDKRRKSYGREVILNVEKAQEKIKMFK